MKTYRLCVIGIFSFQSIGQAAKLASHLEQSKFNVYLRNRTCLFVEYRLCDSTIRYLKYLTTKTKDICSVQAYFNVNGYPPEKRRIPDPDVRSGRQICMSVNFTSTAYLA